MRTNYQVFPNWLCVGYSLCHTLKLGEDPKNVLTITDFFFCFIYVSSHVPYTNLCKGKFTLYNIKKGLTYINLQ